EKADSKLVANFFLNIIPRLESEGEDTSNLKEKDFKQIFTAYSEEKISKNDIPSVIKKRLKKPKKEVMKIIEEEIEKADEEEIRETVEEVLEEKKELVEEKGSHAQGALMGLVMDRIDADGDQVAKILSQELEKKTEE
ncbi:MAG: hypothetical protein ABEI78_01115, partial [Candidatus Nanohaloarchaea archaeon]